MVKTNNSVTMRLHNDFLNLFEKHRENYSKQIGIKISQENFSHLLAKENISFKLPKLDTSFMDNNLINSRKRRK